MAKIIQIYKVVSDQEKGGDFSDRLGMKVEVVVEQYNTLME